MPKTLFMEYSIEYEKIMAVVEDEVSREGAQAYSEDGGSLYDALRILSRDAEKMKRTMSELMLLQIRPYGKTSEELMVTSSSGTHATTGKQT